MSLVVAALFSTLIAARITPPPPPEMEFELPFAVSPDLSLFTGDIISMRLNDGSYLSVDAPKKMLQTAMPDPFSQVFL